MYYPYVQYDISDTENQKPRKTGLVPIGVEASTLTELVFDAIKGAVADGTLAPGERLSESRIASQLGVSKTPVRESLLRLKHIGLVENTERGLSVVRVSAARIRDAYELRAVLEGNAAAFAAERSDQATLDRLVEISQQSVALFETEQFEEREVWDRRFHEMVAQESGNSELSRIVQDVFQLTWTLRLRDLPHSRRIACATDHYDIALALQGRQADTAKALMEKHILAIMDLILATRVETRGEDAIAEDGTALQAGKISPRGTARGASRSRREDAGT